MGLGWGNPASRNRVSSVRDAARDALLAYLLTSPGSTRGGLRGPFAHAAPSLLCAEASYTNRIHLHFAPEPDGQLTSTPNPCPRLSLMTPHLTSPYLTLPHLTLPHLTLPCQLVPQVSTIREKCIQFKATDNKPRGK